MVWVGMKITKPEEILIRQNEPEKETSCICKGCRYWNYEIENVSILICLNKDKEASKARELTLGGEHTMQRVDAL